MNTIVLVPLLVVGACVLAVIAYEITAYKVMKNNKEPERTEGIPTFDFNFSKEAPYKVEPKDDENV